ncbi:MAG: DGQHR domain-containing protein, partial [Proteobacteria bacterium]|nr:DGQHR domain-containing protein [Pseudomonadota bacterium]
MNKGLNMTRKKTKRKKIKLTEQEKEQRCQEREVRTVMTNIGFKRIPNIGGKEFVYKSRTSEMDDIFYYKNVILILEYTVGQPGEHLLKKNYLYEKINENQNEFIDFLLNEDKLKSFKDVYSVNIGNKFSKNQLQIKIVYCSKKSISQEHKDLVGNVAYFDYHIVKYFESLSRVIKRSSRYEFLDFLGISFDKVGDNVSLSSQSSRHAYSGHILPEEHSSFKEGYKIISFYIDANSLLKRAYVLRQNGWRKKENIGHYQRMFIQSKIKGMRKYLHEKNRVFINNIIATLSIDKIELYNDKNEKLTIDNHGNIKNSSNTKVTPTKIEIIDETNIIGIIDGQHRTYAYHEGDDIYEESISRYRGIQNLLVTGILFPKNENEEKRLKFEANLFMEINANQAGASSKLKQDIELMLNPFSTTTIAKRVLEKLNTSGPLSNLLEEYWYEKGKLKTSSIVSYGLKPLLKLDDEKSKDSIYVIWNNINKSKIKNRDNDEFSLLSDYVDFATEKIRDLLIAFKHNLGSEKWVIDRNNSNSILTVTTVNGILNTLRKLIENEKVNDSDS